jgi:hypothetical protein
MALTGRIERSSCRSAGMPNPSAKCAGTTSPWTIRQISTGVVGKLARSDSTSRSMAVNPCPTSKRMPVSMAGYYLPIVQFARRDRMTSTIRQRIGRVALVPHCSNHGQLRSVRSYANSNLRRYTWRSPISSPHANVTRIRSLGRPRCFVASFHMCADKWS